MLLVADEAYVVGMLQNILIDVSSAPNWKRDLVDLRCIVLADGMLSWISVYTAPGGATYSNLTPSPASAGAPAVTSRVRN